MRIESVWRLNHASCEYTGGVIERKANPQVNKVERGSDVFIEFSFCFARRPGVGRHEVELTADEQIRSRKLMVVEFNRLETLGSSLVHSLLPPPNGVPRLDLAWSFCVTVQRHTVSVGLLRWSCVVTERRNLQKFLRPNPPGASVELFGSTRSKDLCTMAMSRFLLGELDFRSNVLSGQPDEPTCPILVLESPSTVVRSHNRLMVRLER